MDWNPLFPPDEPVIALPNWKRPRLLISARHAPSREAGFYPAHRPTARAYRMLLRARVAAHLQPSRRATGSDWPLENFLRGIVPMPMPPAVRLGTPCAAYKWTLRVSDASGKLAAFIKWGENDSARRRLVHEYEILSSLPRGIGPRALKLGPLGNGLALCLSPVPGPTLSSRGYRTDAKLAQFVNRLTADEPLSIDSHPGFERLRQSAPDAVWRWIDQLGNEMWPVAVQHGDLAPWNIFVMPQDGDDRLAAVDWEYGTMRGAAHLDTAYYWIQIAALMHRRDPRSAMDFAISRMTRGQGILLSPRHARAITALAVYDAWRLAMSDGDSAYEPLQQWQREIWRNKPVDGPVSASMYVPPRRTFPYAIATPARSDSFSNANSLKSVQVHS